MYLPNVCRPKNHKASIQQLVITTICLCCVVSSANSETQTQHDKALLVTGTDYYRADFLRDSLEYDAGYEVTEIPDYSLDSREAVNGYSLVVVDSDAKEVPTYEVDTIAASGIPVVSSELLLEGIPTLTV